MSRTATPTVPVAPIAPAALPTPDDLKQLMEQRRALDAQIKSAKAAQASVSKLERVIAQQNAHLDDVTGQRLVARVRARVKAGQPQDEALAQVFADYRAAVEGALATMIAEEADVIEA